MGQRIPTHPEIADMVREGDEILEAERYERIFENLGFDPETIMRYNDETGEWEPLKRNLDSIE